MSKATYVRVTNPNGVTSWVTAKHAEALLRQPGWKKAAEKKQGPKKGAKPPEEAAAKQETEGE